MLIKCKCGNEDTKIFISIVDHGGASCKKCTIIESTEKIANNNIHKETI